MSIEAREQGLRRRTRRGIALLAACTFVLGGIAAFRGPGFDWSLGARTWLVRRLLTKDGWTLLTLARSANGIFEFTGYLDETYCHGAGELAPPLRAPRVRVLQDCSVTQPLDDEERDCLRGLPSCSSAAHRNTLATPPRVSRAIRFAELGCDQNQLFACSGAGYLLLHVDPARAVRAFDRACDGGDDGACEHLAQILDGAHGAQYRDAIGACDAFERARTLSAANDYAHTKLALCFESGVGRPRDLARARQMLAQSCAEHDDMACAHISENRILGRGVTLDVARGRSELESRCEGGHVTDCEALARLLEEGAHLPADFATSIALRAKSCELGSAESCLIASAAYTRGAPELAADPERAGVLVQRYCSYTSKCDEHGVPDASR